jgi:type III pantothenate kinase
MKWLMDLGNTRLKLTALDAPDSPVLISLSSLSSIDDWNAALGKISSADRVYVCSVAAPAQKDLLYHSLQQRGAEVVYAQVSTAAAGIKTRYDPSRLGIDRFLQLIAARHLNSAAQLVISVGSAMTVDLLDHQGVHHGGWIAPRAEHLREALTENFPALRLAAARSQDDVLKRQPHFALNTADAIESGVLAMQRGSVEYALNRARSILSADIELTFCGGGGSELAEFFPSASYHPWLALQGLALWAEWSEQS